MGFYDAPTTDAPNTPASGGFYDTPIGNSTSNFTNNFGQSPAIKNAVNSLPDTLPEPKQGSKVGDFLKNFLRGDFQHMFNPEVAAAVNSLPTPKKSMTFPLIEGPSTEDIKSQSKSLNDLKNKLNTHDQNSIDKYNSKVDEFNQKLTQYQIAQNAHQVISKVDKDKDGNPIGTDQSAYSTPMKKLSYDLSQILNEPIHVAGQALGSTKFFENWANKSDEGKFIPSFTEDLAKHLQYAQGGISGFTGGIIKPEYTEEPKDAVSKLVSMLSQGVGMAVGIGKIESGMGIQGAPQALLKNFQNYPKIAKLFNGLAKSIPAFATYGQLNPDLKGASQRLKTLGIDIATAIPFTALGLFNKLPIAVPATAALGFGMAKLSGANNMDAAVSGTALGLLTLFGESGKATGKEVITQKEAQGQLRQQAIETINKWSDTKINNDSSPTEIKKAFKEAALKTHPDVGGEGKDFSAVAYARDILDPSNKKTTESKMSEKPSEKTPTKEDLSNIANEVKSKPEMAFREDKPEPLAEEAKKYKSAEEFVNSQTKDISEKASKEYPSFKKYNYEETSLSLNQIKQREIPDLATEKFKEIKKSVSRGDRTPIIVDESNFILDGHHRFNAYKELGANYGSVPVLKVIGEGEGKIIKSKLTDIYNKAHGLDSNGKPIDNETYGKRSNTEGGNGDLSKGGQGAQHDSGASNGSVERSFQRDLMEAAGRLSGHSGEDGVLAKLVARSARELGKGNPVQVDDTTFKILKEVGFSDPLIQNLKDAQLKGAVKDIVISETVQGKSFVSAYKAGVLYLNPGEMDHPTYKNGDIIKHELSGHSWYRKLSSNDKLTFYKNLQENKETIKSAWKDSDNPYKNYWSRTLEYIANSIQNQTDSEQITDRIIKDFGLEFNKDISLDSFINQSLALDKTLAAINAELARIGKNPINIEAQNTAAVEEHVAMIAENSKKIFSTNNLLQNYIEDVNDGTLAYGPDATNNLIYQGESDLSLRTLEKLNGRDSVSKQFISDLTNSGDIKQVERDILRDVLAQYPDGAKIPVKEFADKVKIELLPLTVIDSREGVPRYESISLPNESKGNVADYFERIYESPVKTSAGNIHFGSSPMGDEGGIENYFGHTRVEDMADEAVRPVKDFEDMQDAVKSGKKVSYDNKTIISNQSSTRRVIEVQSDLYQKGRLEKEERMDLVNETREGDIQTEGFKKLKQYNDPTAHFRMVREEIKQAAIDGKTKLQFPTGETAMKIEGLGNNEGRNRWFNAEITPEGHGRTTTQLTSEDLKVDNAINGHGGTWIITDVLGDGKFKAVPKNVYENYQKQGLKLDEPWNKANRTEMEKGIHESFARAKEEFDISGKVDTNNPIYRFYEKDLGRYLKNQYDAKPVTDENGVTWNEVDVKPEMGESPVMAFREHDENLVDLRRKLKANQDALDKAIADPDLFAEHIPKLQKQVDDLREQIKLAKNPPVESAQEALANVEKRTGVKSVNIPQVQNQLNRVQLSLKAASEAPEAHQKAYGRDKRPEYQAKIEELQSKLRDAIKAPEMPHAPKIRVLNKEIEIPEDLYHRQLSLEIKKQDLQLNQAGQLGKYVAQSGEFKGELPEVGPITKSVEKIRDPNVIKWIKQGDSIATEFGFKDSEEAREAWKQYVERKKSLQEEGKVLRKDLATYIIAEKDRISIERFHEMRDQEVDKEQAKAQKIADKIRETQSLQDWKSFVSSFAEEISLPKTLEEVNPPVGRGGIQAPRLNLVKAKDKGWMARETFDRNVEKVFTREDAKKINEFLGDHIRENATLETAYINKMFEEMGTKMKGYGIRKGSKDASLIQIYGENLITIEELKKYSPKKYEEIQKAVADFKDIYARAIRDWNMMRKQFGYPPIPERTDYFPHFQDISFWTKNYGLLNSDDNLPTAIAGKTQNFKPGKVFSRHELTRTGKNTKYDAIEGMEVYIRSVAKQMFSMDSIARARALDKYIVKSAETAQRLGTPLQLSQFQTNLDEYTQSQLASKQGGLDRAIERFGKRPVINAVLTVSKLIGKNIIVFNPAAAMTHLVSITLNAATVNKVPFLKGMMTTVSSPFSKEEFYMIDGIRSDFLYRRYPKEHISATRFETAEQAGGWMLKQMDIFKSRTAVASKYYELRDQGVDRKTAIKQADIYAGRIVGDYSRGQKPNLLNQKILHVLAQFQFGMNDGISVLMHDIPYQNKKTKDGVIQMKQNKDGTWSDKAKNDYRKQIWKYAQWAIYAFLLNQVLKQIKGSGKGLSPIDVAFTLGGVNEDGRGKPFAGRLGAAGKELAGELPFTSIATGNFPSATVFTQFYKDAVAGNLLKAGEGLAAMFASPIGGGSQVKKTISGIEAYKKGYVANSAGVPQFPIKKGVGSALQSALFGPSGNSTAQSFYNAKGTKSPMQDTYNELQTLKAEGKEAEAQAIIDGMTDEEYKSYTGVKSAAKAQATKTLAVQMIPQTQNIQNLVKAGKEDEAQTLIDAMTDEEYAAYNTSKKLLATATTKTQSTFGSGGTWEKQSFVTHVVNIAKAATLHPIEFFSNVFDGAGDWRVTGIKGNQIIVNRMPSSASSAIRRASGKDTSEYQLDHIIPLEAGGNNSADNLQMIPKSEDDANTSIENLIASKLASGAISGAKAKEFSIRYKAGLGDALSPAYMELYTKKYKGLPITEEEIRNY